MCLCWPRTSSTRLLVTISFIPSFYTFSTGRMCLCWPRTSSTRRFCWTRTSVRRPSSAWNTRGSWRTRRPRAARTCTAPSAATCCSGRAPAPTPPGAPSRRGPTGATGQRGHCARTTAASSPRRSTSCTRTPRCRPTSPPSAVTIATTVTSVSMHSWGCGWGFISRVTSGHCIHWQLP